MVRSIGVIGAGGWGTALAKLLAEKTPFVTLWCHSAETHRIIQENRENRTYLPGIRLPDRIAVTCSIEQAVAEKDMVFCAVPSHGVRSVMTSAGPFLRPRTQLVCGTKGLEEDTLKTMGEALTEIFGAAEKRSHAFLSGPTFALEVAQGLPAAVTVAAYADEVARDIQETLSTESFRVYTSSDVIGVQMGGVIKNVIAIAAGISDGLELGYNARAALITRGLAEMTRLAVAMGAEPTTLAGLPGLGDLVLTCTGHLSRNRQVGVQIGRGENLQKISAGMKMVAEGIRNTRSIYFLAKRLEVEMPIVAQMYAVLYESKRPLDAVRDLMLRSLKPENP
jgi:glycerol-3-phosphate dehydrogenase (NAD(P)+)